MTLMMKIFLIFIPRVIAILDVDWWQWRANQPFQNNSFPNFFFTNFTFKASLFTTVIETSMLLSVVDILYDLSSEQKYLGIRNVTFRLFVNNYHLYFFCQIITYGHHLSKNIITSQLSQFSFLACFWRIEPYLSC